MGFAERLQQARLKKGYKQNELSLLIGRSKNTVSNYENGISKPNLDDLIKLMNLLEVDANFLLYDDLSTTVKNQIENSTADICKDLNSDGKLKVQTYIEDLKSSGKYNKNEQSNSIKEDIANELKQEKRIPTNTK